MSKTGIGRRSARRAIATALTATAAMAALSTSAGAEDPTKDSYTAAAEQICKVNTEANARIFKGARSEVKAGKFDKAARRVRRAVVAFEKTVARLAALPRPPADEAKLQTWLGLLRLEGRLLAKIGKALGAGDKFKIQSYSQKLRRNSNRANNAVLLFDFDYCRLDPTRFS